MAIEVQLTLTCDEYECDKSCVALAPLSGRKVERLRVDATMATLPEGWWIGMRRRGYGCGEDLSCACPEHAKELRGY